MGDNNGIWDVLSISAFAEGGRFMILLNIKYYIMKKF